MRANWALDSIKKRSTILLSKQTFDNLAVGVLDFSNKRYDCFEIKGNKGLSKKPQVYFDLASLTKPLTLGLSYLKYRHFFDSNLTLLLNHKGGLPSGGRLARSQWRNHIRSFPIISTETLYSDYSALRLMLELEEKSGEKMEKLCEELFDQNIYFWKNLGPLKEKAPVTGFRNGQEIRGEVHDDNAFVIGEFCSHAGLFARVNDLCETLIFMDGKYNLLAQIEEEIQRVDDKQRFIGGWDRVLNSKTTLAGEGASEGRTFGHLGFTGTSIWIDLNKRFGFCLLTNGTKKYWYQRKGLNYLRRELGKDIWKWKDLQK